MAALTAQQITLAGITPVLQAAAAGGDTCPTGEDVFLRIKNADASPHTVTLHTTATLFGQPITNPTVTIAAAGEKSIGPLTTAEFGDPTTGLISLTYDAVTSVTVGCFAL